MKKYIFIPLIIACISSCNSNKTDQPSANTVVDSTKVKTDSVVTKKDSHYFWTADLDQKGLQLKKTDPISADSLNTENMIGRLNSQHPEIKLELVRSSHDTLYLRINKSNYLTQQMGSSGAEAYMAEATYNLTEIPGINYVDLKFKEGDHASPGTYSRTDFVH